MTTVDKPRRQAEFDNLRIGYGYEDFDPAIHRFVVVEAADKGYVWPCTDWADAKELAEVLPETGYFAAYILDLDTGQEYQVNTVSTVTVDESPDDVPK